MAAVTINVPEMQLMGAVPTRPFMQTVNATSGQYTDRGKEGIEKRSEELMGTPENVGEVSRDPAATSSCKFTPEGKADWAPAHGALHHPGTNTLWVRLLSSPQSSLP